MQDTRGGPTSINPEIMPKNWILIMLVYIQTSSETSTRRVRSHANDWLRHLANVNKARIKHPRSRRQLVTPPSEWRWIAVLVCKMHLWPFSPKTMLLLFLGYPKVFSVPSFSTLGSIVFWVMLQTHRQTDSHHHHHHIRLIKSWHAQLSTIYSGSSIQNGLIDPVTLTLIF